MNNREPKKIIVTPASQIDFKSEKFKKSFKKVKQKKEEIAKLMRIDYSKLQIRITV